MTPDPMPNDPMTPDPMTPGAAPADVASGLLATLPPAAASVRGAAFIRLRHRDVASVAAPAADTGLTDEAVRDALAVLVRTGTATVDDVGHVVAVGGLSVVPTAHELVLDGEPFWTWCAFDAVGIPAALRVDAVARTRCGHCGDHLDVTLTAGQPPAGSLVAGWLPGQACTNVQVDFCPAANLFCDGTHLAAWRERAGDPPGRAATLPERTVLGMQVWTDMSGTTSPDTGEH